MTWPFFPLPKGNYQPEALARLPVNCYNSLSVKVATIPWILVTLPKKKLVCKAFPGISDTVKYVEASSNLWLEAEEGEFSNALEDGKCELSGLLKKPKFALNVEVEGNEIIDDILLYMRAFLVHKPICKGLSIKLNYGDEGKEVVFRVKNVRKESESDEFALVAPQTTFTFYREEPTEQQANELKCPAGLEGPFNLIKDILDPLIINQMRSIGVSLPRGILMSGPPGVGKTFLVQEIARSSKIPLIVVNGPELISPVPGESEENLSRVFEGAKAAAEGTKERCSIVFFDEFDAIARKRESDSMESLSEVRLLTQLLTLMDGFDQKSSGDDCHVIIFAATNRPNALDPAMRRPGRFDREIIFEPPDAPTRTIILESLLKDFNLSEVSMDTIGRNCVGYVSADLASLAQEVSMLVDPESKHVKTEHFIKSMKQVGPSLHRQYQVALDNRVTWRDIAGIDEIRDELRRFIEWPLLYPDAYERMGLVAPRGVLLYGPPGCSKTTIAKAIANESGFTFYSLNGAALYSCFVGESEQQIRDIFQCSRMTCPSVIFFDEIDAIVGNRSSEIGVGAGDSVQERVLSTLLNEMDGISVGSKRNVLVIGATNRRDLIDDALLRPGRFDRHIYIPLPSEKGRKEIIDLFLEGKSVDPSVNTLELAENTSGFSGADLKGLIQEAAILAMYDESFTFKMEHFRKVLESPGRKKNK